MGARNPARVLAPLALVAALVGVVVVIQASKPGSSEPSVTPSATQRTATQPVRRARPRPRFYVVQSGDTLSAVAEQSGVALETILRLNPDVDPNALQTGQRLKLGP